MKTKFLLLISIFSLSNLYFSQKYEKEATISNQDIKVVYAGIPMSFSASAMGNYENVYVSPEVIVPTQDQVGSYVTINCIGVDKKGKEKVIGSEKYLVKPTPKPELKWGGFLDNERVSSFSPELSVAFGDNIPFVKEKGNFTVESYVIAVSGLKGTLNGEGSEISEIHLVALKNITKGSKVAIQVKYSGTSSGMLSAMFEL
jgi:hypothetical protein